MTFRTPAEAVQLANNTRYGLAASVWSENINVALDIAPKIKAGVVWVNCTNQFDAAAGFGGYRESGFGREGGLRGLYEYLKRKAQRRESRGSEQASHHPHAVAGGRPAHARGARRSIRTPPSCSSAASRRGPTAATAARLVRPHDGTGCRPKWARATARISANAVEAAFNAERLGQDHRLTLRAQILYTTVAENLSAPVPGSSPRAAFA